MQQLKNEIAFLKGVISNKNWKIFGSYSKQVDINHLSLFNEAEEHSDSKVEEYVTYSYSCKICESVNENSKIISTEASKTFLE